MRPRWTVFPLAAVIAMVSMVSVTAAAHAAELTFTSPDQLGYALPESKDKLVWLRSDGAESADIEWQLVVDQNSTKPLIVNEKAAAKKGEPSLDVKGPPGIAANAVAPYRVQINDLDAKDVKGAQLVALASGAAPAALDVHVSAKTTPNPSIGVVLIAPLVVAFLFMGCRWIRLDGDTVGTVDLDFTKSFATTLTAIGALLGTILSAGLIDEEASPISKTGFQALNLTFGVLVLIAPLFFLIVQQQQTSTETVNGQQVTVTHYKGPTWALLLASMVTLWAVLGEIWTVYLLLGETDTAGDISSLAITVMQIAFGVGAVLAAIYSWRKLKWIVDTPAGAAAPALAGGFMPAIPPPASVHQPWTPL